MKNKNKIIIVFALLTSFILIHCFNDKEIGAEKELLAIQLDGEYVSNIPEKGKYGVEITCNNSKPEWDPEKWKLYLSNITGKVKCFLNFTSSPELLKNVVEENATNIETVGYRYQGTYYNTQNYIDFNNELWRIIGSIPTKTNADGTVKNLVKIARVDSLNGYAYDAKTSNYTTAWGSNTLYSLLNSYYYGALDGTDTEGCFYYADTIKGKCDFTKNGIIKNSHYGNMIKNVYWNTGTISTTNRLTAYNQEIVNQTVTGEVGLITISDYYYSGAGTSTTGWLRDSNYTITPYSTGIRGFWKTTALVNITPNEGNSVKPVVYLDETVYIVSGDGSYDTPYQIAM